MMKPVNLLSLLLLLLICPFGLRALNESAELDGQQLLVTSVRTGNTDVFLVNPATGDARNLTRHPAEDRYPAWSPDGRLIAFTSDRDGAFNLYVMNSDGGEVRQLTREKSPAVCYFPSWSGDGKQIVFGLAGEKTAIMATIAPDGSNFKSLGEGRDPFISPDGRRLAFTKRAGQGFAVFVRNVDGSGERQLTTNENRIGAVGPTWSPDGTKILYSDQVGQALEVFVVDAGGGAPRQLTSLGRLSASALYSPDMKWISFRVTDEAYWRNAATRDKVYQEKAGEKRPVYVMRADGSNPHVVEVLRYQCAMDGSRAAWRPQERNGRTRRNTSTR